MFRDSDKSKVGFSAGDLNWLSVAYSAAGKWDFSRGVR